MAEEKGLETLQVWQKAMALAVKVQQEILPLLPPEEKWAMAAQLRRSVQSIPGNIAEGYGRYYFQESVRFCYIARGSLE
jgi:four helix bundle protein